MDQVKDTLIDAKTLADDMRDAINKGTYPSKFNAKLEEIEESRLEKLLENG